jgi:predicted nuclease with TOPRIM domain
MIDIEKWQATVMKDLGQLKAIVNQQQLRISKLEHENSKVKEKVRVQAGEIAFLKRKQ